jgi:hypothetical protein
MTKWIEYALLLRGEYVLWQTRSNSSTRSFGICPLATWSDTHFSCLKSIALIAQSSIIPINLLEAR